MATGLTRWIRAIVAISSKTSSSLLIAVALLAMAFPIEAHPGRGGYSGGSNLEAEDYNDADSSCDPDFDGEHTQISGSYVFLPHSGCGIEFNDLCFASWADFYETDVIVGGTSDYMTYTVSVFLDGDTNPHGSSTFTQRNSDGVKTRVFNSSPYSIPPGIHDVRVEYTVDSGPFGGNLFIDNFYIFYQSYSTCTGNQETLCPVFAVTTINCLI